MSHNEEFQKKAAEDRRLVILRFLDEEDDGLMSASLMQDALAMMAHRVSRAQVLEDAGVFKRNEAGRAAFRRFLGTADQEGSL